MIPNSQQLSTVNTYWGAVAAEVLVRLGVHRVVISPGSRSTPLTVAFALHPKMRAWSVLDERAAGFFALGMAQRSGEVVALLCTSGTAAANYLPAVIEAHESNIPLLILTADRPPELRHTRAGQTIDQVKMYGSAVAFYAEAPIPENEVDVLRSWPRLLSQAVDHARECSGPVHLNCPFREPLAWLAGTELKPVVPFDQLVAVGRLPVVTRHIQELPPLEGRGLIIAGPDHASEGAAYREAAFALALSRAAPIFCDVLSPTRHGTCPEGVVRIAAYDRLLRSDAINRDDEPDWLIILGELPTSKALRQWVGKLSGRRYLVSRHPGNRDASQGRVTHLRLRLEELGDWPGKVVPASYRERWKKLSRKASIELKAGLDAAPIDFEGRIYAEAAAQLPEDVDLFFASSLAVRDGEAFWPVTPEARRVFFNRGANGIDGTVASAMGTVAEGGRTCLFCGDLAALHDATGWLCGQDIRGALVVVVINNEGGGIFQHLPIAAWEPPFERFFGTPQKIDFKAFACAFGVSYVQAADAVDLGEHLSCFPEKGVTLIEVKTNRRASAAIRVGLLNPGASARAATTEVKDEEESG